VLLDPIVELSVHERRTLLRIAKGDARTRAPTTRPMSDNCNRSL
jgi:hypothetical protein